jgi:uncharacterized RDD family membrane protein YckC
MATTNNPSIDFTHWIMRATAYLIDSLILLIGVIIILSITDSGISGILVSWVVLSAIYFILIEAFWGRTVGKKIVGLKVQLITGGKISFAKSIIRNISKITLVGPLIGWLIAVITSGADRRQRWTDRFAKTTVVQTRQIIQTAPAIPTTN